MDFTTVFDQLFSCACPSIRYRVRKELLNQSPCLPEMLRLQDQILQDDTVRKVIHLQSPDGWFAPIFHGYESMESRMRLLCEKGVEANQPILASALKALGNDTDRFERGLGRVGKILDDLGFGGIELIRATLFAHAGIEHFSMVQEQIKRALEVLKMTIQVQSLESLCQPYKDKLVYRDGIRWPGIYQLRLLAMTQSWRTLENRKIIAESIQQVVKLSPIPTIYIRYKSQLVAPASFCMHDFVPNMNRLSDSEWMQWFQRMELLARLGIVGQIPELRQQVESLTNLLHQGQGLFTKKLQHIFFRKWGAYTGLMLEKDWQLAQRRINDLTFRSLLILHYAGL